MYNPLNVFFFEFVNVSTPFVQRLFKLNLKNIKSKNVKKTFYIYGSSDASAST